MSDDVSAKLDEFFNGYRMRKFAKGQVLILNGDVPGHVFHLVKGIVKKYDVSYRGDEIIVNIFKPPAYFPMSLALNKGSNKYIYEAETDIEVRQVPDEEIIAFLKSNPDVMYDLLCRLYKGMDGILGRMTYLMSSNANNRLMYELIIEARRFGKKQSNGSIELSISEIELGARAGLSRETVSREMAKLKKEGLLTAEKKKFYIKDLSMLEKKLEKET